MKHCITLHLHYQDLWPEFREKLQPLLNSAVHLYVTVNAESEYTDDMRSIAKEVYVIENRGADVAPFIYVYNKIQMLGYQTYLKLHGKKSVHTPGIGDAWRKSLYVPIVEHYAHILQHVAAMNMPCMAGASHWYFDMVREPLNHPNKQNIREYLNAALTALNLTPEGSFFAGTMFLTNDIYLKKLFGGIDLDVLYERFEPGYHSHSFAHGMERALGYGIHQFAGTYIKI
jgi:lipopolysaccharide biosynthesis protein